MNTLLRWGKFNLVGAMGMVVQLAALALFNRWMAGHYFYASAAAIELTLLHNFVWHLHYTWRDRRDDSTRLRQLVRFHLSNGLVSMLGNLALMRLLVHEAHLPLLVSDGIAILCCSVVNFCLGNNWAFAEARKGAAQSKSEVPEPHVHSFPHAGFAAFPHERHDSSCANTS
jgi:putative flippase GtrA